MNINKFSNYLEDKKISVCVTSGIAAMEVPKIIRQLRRYGAEINVIMSRRAKKYFGTLMFQWASGNEVITEITGKAEHIRINDDAALVLPATLNTIGKIANGECPDALTTYLASAIGMKIPIIIAPTMHKSMYDNPFFLNNLNKLSKLKNIAIISPRFEEEKAKIAIKEKIISKIIRSTSKSQLKGKSVLITAGPTRGYLDQVRFITNMSSGQLGLDIANDLYLRGADVKVVFGPGKAIPQSYLKIIKVKTPDEMLNKCLDELKKKCYDIAIFSAAVSDYIPDKVVKGKIKSGKELIVSFKKTKKIIKEVDSVKRKKNTKLFKVGFKLETLDSDDELISRGYESLLENKCHLVVANNLGQINSHKHRAFLITPERNYTKLHSKPEIVSALAKQLEIIWKEKYKK